MSPEEVTLTFEEIHAADEILKTVIDRFNQSTNSSLSFRPFDVYRAKYRDKTDGVWEEISETSRLVSMWCDSAILQVLGLEEGRANSIINNYGEITLRDKFVTGAAVAVGPHSNVSADVIQQNLSNGPKAFDIDALAEELGRLRTAMREIATEPEQDIAIAEVAQAQTAATNGDEQKALQHLKAAGTWAFDVATKIGVGVATAAIKFAAGW
ncbi:hypothetical protein NKI71_13695 [Mesorhizobium sp. M0510]|uniref:hypothetical protein n=1 Tax=Mesorhizobium sp. M0510 TaxID=2956954 RepID=UPI003334C658